MSNYYSHFYHLLVGIFGDYQYAACVAVKMSLKMEISRIVS
jgi:hypothetical protein